MPLRLLFAFVLLTPLAGVYLLEQGEYSLSLGMTGHANGATWAFLGYGLVFVVTASLVSRGQLFRSAHASAFDAKRKWPDVRRVVRAGIVVNGLLCVVSLFAFGGLSVLAGDVGKGEIRSSLGGLGAPAYLTLKWLAPSVFAYACALYVLTGRPRAARAGLWALALVSYVIGLSWGFKTSGISVVLPGLVLLLWFSSARTLLPLAAIGMGLIFAAFYLFDTLEGLGYASVLDFLFARLTIFQGEMAWFTWDLLQSREPLPAYPNPIPLVLGDRFFSLMTGITRDDAMRWVETHYGSLITYIAGYPLEAIEEGHNVTGTPFAEGIVAFGHAGIVLFAVCAGALSGFVYRRICVALAEGRPLAAALWCNYAIWALLAWLNGGEVLQVVHISILVGAVASGALLALLTFLAPRRLYRIAPALRTS